MKTLEILKEAGLTGKLWVKGDIVRFYLRSSSKDINSYVQFEKLEAFQDGENFEGAVLKVFSNSLQSPKWLVNRAKQVKHGIMCDIASAWAGFEICTEWEDVIL